MMKEFIGLSLFLLFLSVSQCFAQNSAAFAELERFIETNKKYDLFPHGDETVKLFNVERRRLGGNFEQALFSYLGSDVDKYYWLSLYLTEEEYLDGNKPLPELSLRVKQMGLELTETHSDTVSTMNIVGLNVTAAILSKKLKKNDLAIKYKAVAENLIKKDEYAGTFPALDDKDREIYESITF